MPTADLNADVGESYGRWVLGHDAELLEIVTSANIACGAYAGDATTMRICCELAVEHGVRVGAQVGYRDVLGFGRRMIDVDPGELRDDIVIQIGALAAAARVAGTSVSYVKPHGALYHAITHDREQAQAVVSAVLAYQPTLALVGLPGSLSLRMAAAAGLATVREGFADRGYAADGSLVDRRLPGAVITDPAVTAARAVTMIVDHQVIAMTGESVPLEIDSVCLHGDSPDAVDAARAVRAALRAAGVTVVARPSFAARSPAGEPPRPGSAGDPLPTASAGPASRTGPRPWFGSVTPPAH